MFKFSKFFIVALSDILLVGIFSFSLAQYNDASNGSDHSQHNEHSQKSSDKESYMNMNDHQHKGMSEMPTEDDVDVKFTLAASFFEKKRVFIGVSGNINGQINPVLEVPQGAVVEITLLNDTVLQHNFVIPSLALHSEHVSSSDAVTFTFQ